MANETYSVQALIVENGKNIKSTLTLTLDMYEFNGKQKPIDWEKASCSTGTTKVKSFIFSSEKPYVVIKEGQQYGPAFVLEQSQVDELIAKVAELGELAKQRRIAEEERKRKEEEERRQREAEERKRIKEEERRRKKEEERKRKEEKERRLRMEEERKRREEEEQRRREEERRRKEEEERKRREALEKRQRERKNRIVEEVEASKTGAEQVDLSGGSDLVLKKAWGIIADNPYRILGVSVSATTDETNAALDKIKKLARLNAVASFKSEFHLNGTNKPERDVSIVQNAITITKEMKYKWFWFAEPDACIAWQNEKYRKELVYDGPEYGNYDLFLANYFYALIFDPSFSKSTLWKPVFSYFAYICTENSHEMIKSRFNEKELSQISAMDAMRSFKAEIFRPLEALCDTEDAYQIMRLYTILKEIKDSSIDELKKTVTMKLTKWFTSREKKVCDLVDESDEDKVITAEEAREIRKAGDVYVKEVDRVVDKALEAVKTESVRYEMIKESYRHATWQLMWALNKAGQRENAIIYANKTYPYCSESDKRKIRGTFGFNAIKGADRDATNAEWDIMGDNYYEGKNGYEQDYDEAFKWYKKAAEAGNMYSQNSMGICYREGNGTYQSDYEAAKWFEKAYKSGNPDGAFNLAHCYAIGKGKVTDQKKAVDLYLEAAKMGHPAAADVGKKLIDLMIAQQKIHRLTQHKHYDLGYQIPIGETILVEVTLNYSANVYLMEDDDYNKYVDCDNFSYYGGRATQSPYRIKIPHTGSWHLVIDNGDNDMTGIIASVHTRTFNF